METGPREHGPAHRYGHHHGLTGIGYFIVEGDDECGVALAVAVAAIAALERSAHGPGRSWC
jgi:hypothetical protein